MILRIHHYGVEKFSKKQANGYFNAFCFETIAERPLSFQPVDFIKNGYQRYPCVYYRIVNNVVERMDIIGRQSVNF